MGYDTRSRTARAARAMMSQTKVCDTGADRAARSRRRECPRPVREPNPAVGSTSGSTPAARPRRSRTAWRRLSEALRSSEPYDEFVDGDRRVLPRGPVGERLGCGGLYSGRREMLPGLGRDTAVEAAERAAGWLPSFASALHRDAQAPVNLTPTAGLERHLPRLQGDARLPLRAAREAVLERTAKPRRHDRQEETHRARPPHRQRRGRTPVRGSPGARPRHGRSRRVGDLGHPRP